MLFVPPAPLFDPTARLPASPAALQNTTTRMRETTAQKQSALKTIWPTAVHRPNPPRYLGGYKFNFHYCGASLAQAASGIPLGLGLCFLYRVSRVAPDCVAAASPLTNAARIGLTGLETC